MYLHVSCRIDAYRYYKMISLWFRRLHWMSAIIILRIRCPTYCHSADSIHFDREVIYTKFYYIVHYYCCLNDCFCLCAPCLYSVWDHGHGCCFFFFFVSFFSIIFFISFYLAPFDRISIDHICHSHRLFFVFVFILYSF